MKERTSGFGLDGGSAARLHDAGAVGVAVSLTTGIPPGTTYSRPCWGLRARRGGTRALPQGDWWWPSPYDTGVHHGRQPGSLRAPGAGSRRGFLRVLMPRAVGRWEGCDVERYPGAGRAPPPLRSRHQDQGFALSLWSSRPSARRPSGASARGTATSSSTPRASRTPALSAGTRRGWVLAGAMPGTLARLRRGCHAFPRASPDAPEADRRDAANPQEVTMRHPIRSPSPSSAWPFQLPRRPSTPTGHRVRPRGPRETGRTPCASTGDAFYSAGWYTCYYGSSTSCASVPSLPPSPSSWAHRWISTSRAA